MKRAHVNSFIDRKWLPPTIILGIFSLVLVLTVTFFQPKFSPSTDSPDSEFGLAKLPRFTYLISGTKDEVPRVKRLLQAVYHPRNYYVLHLDLDASDKERLELAKFVKSDAVVREFRNVMVVGEADLLTYKGPTVVAATLHAVAILHKQVEGWDWFVNLDAWDYPLISQDGTKWI
ncbi:hypothetical protein Ancab_032022 [Ancistrocladus abbreviatus]